MLKFDEVEIRIKDDLINFIDYFNDIEKDKLLEYSFFLNNISKVDGKNSIIFTYSCFSITHYIYESMLVENLFCLIKDMKIFKNAYTIFRREIKINIIIDNE